MSKYQRALEEIKNMLNDMTQNENDSFKYHYYVKAGTIDLLQELVNEKLEQESRKDKLIVGNEWECVAENRGRNAVFKKGIQTYIWEVKENFVNFGHGTVYGYVRDSVPIEQFLLCFKFLKEGEQL